MGQDIDQLAEGIAHVEAAHAPFYFPISYATTPKRFADDERLCQARCPGTDVQLYYHRVQGEESEDMISLSGIPYRNLPTAFLYRRTDRPRPQACGCEGTSYSAIGATPQDDASLKGSSTAAPDVINVGQPTQAKASVASPPASPRLVTPPSDADRRVRVVGPQFFPDPSTAIDLRAPDRKEAP